MCADKSTAKTIYIISFLFNCKRTVGWPCAFYVWMPITTESEKRPYILVECFSTLTLYNTWKKTLKHEQTEFLQAFRISENFLDIFKLLFCCFLVFSLLFWANMSSLIIIRRSFVIAETDLRASQIIFISISCLVFLICYFFRQFHSTKRFCSPTNIFNSFIYEVPI